MATSSNANMSLGTVVDALFPKVQSADAALRARIQSLGTDPSPKEMLEVQTDMQSFTIAIEIQATVVKTLGDSLKSVVQKST